MYNLLSFITSPTTLTEYLAWVAAVGGSIIGIYKFAQFLKKIAIKPIIDFFIAVDKCINIINKMDYEFTTNGGKSIKDAIIRIESNLLSNEQRTRAILSHLPYPIFESDKDGKCIWVNKEYQRLVGKDLNELRGYGWVNAIASEDRDRVIFEWDLAVKQNREFTSKYYIINTNDQRVLVLCHTSMIYGKNDTITNFIGYLEPIGVINDPSIQNS